MNPAAETAPTPILLAQDIADAVTFRELVGLRSDVPWIQFVASSPERDLTYSVPLTRAEARDLKARTTTASEVAETIIRYGLEQPNEWAGLYIDQARESTVVAQFTGNVLAHRSAIGALVGPTARWDVRQVQYTIVELQALKAEVEKQLDWVDAHGFEFESLGVHERENRVVLGLRIPAGQDAGVIADHLGGVPRLAIEVKPLRVWTGGYGSLTIISKTPTGRPVADLDIFVSFDRWTGWDRSPGVGTDPDGVTTLAQFPATTVTVTLMKWVGPHRVVVGETSTMVAPHRETMLDMVVVMPDQP